MFKPLKVNALQLNPRNSENTATLRHLIFVLCVYSVLFTPQSHFFYYVLDSYSELQGQHHHLHSKPLVILYTILNVAANDDIISSPDCEVSQYKT